MQTIVEPIFEIVYLIGVIVLGILIIQKSKGKKQFLIFGIMAIVLGVGDAFHLIPRMWALFTTGTTTMPEHVVALGFGKLITSLTMTVFYVLLYHIWQLRYKKYNMFLTLGVYILAIVRIILCLLPQNLWLDSEPPLSWGIYRNIPFVILGILIIILYFQQAYRNQDRTFRYMWLAITLSFLFYIPVVLFAESIPLIGMLMIPKTCAYVWIVSMGFKGAKERYTSIY